MENIHFSADHITNIIGIGKCPNEHDTYFDITDWDFDLI